MVSSQSKFYCRFNRISLRLELVESSLFSPLTQIINDYGECGTCKDSNAICMTAAQEKTCWCRAGFRNNNGACGKSSKI